MRLTSEHGRECSNLLLKIPAVPNDNDLVAHVLQFRALLGGAVLPGGGVVGRSVNKDTGARRLIVEVGLHVSRAAGSVLRGTR